MWVFFLCFFPSQFCDPDCLVQPPISWIAPKSIGEGASSLLGGWFGSPENVSCSRATPDLHRCDLGVALEQETFSGLPNHPPKRLLAPSPIDLGAIQEIGGCTRQSGSQSQFLQGKKAPKMSTEKCPANFTPKFVLKILLSFLQKPSLERWEP